MDSSAETTRARPHPGITALISSHIIDELSRLAIYYGFLDGGHAVKKISAKELEMRSRVAITRLLTRTATVT